MIRDAVEVEDIQIDTFHFLSDIRFLKRRGCEATSSCDLLGFVSFHNYGDPSTSHSHQTGFTVAPQGEIS
jgi:hypothetical protein